MKAVIDLGTNTFHLFIGAIEGNKLVEHYKLQIPVKLGKGGINHNQITKESFARGLVALEEFKKHINLFGVTDVTAIATSAIRNAQNGHEFIAAVKNQFNITITSITGDEEAVFIYKGVQQSLLLPPAAVLVMDIGGGSVEFIIGVQQHILYKQSFEIGAARLLERFRPQNPITMEEVEQIEAYLHKELLAVKTAVLEHGPDVLIGAAGAFETLADVIHQDLLVEPLAIGKKAREIKLDDFNRFVNMMKNFTLKQRTCLKGMVDFRIEMITLAAILMDVVVRTCGIRKIIVSDYSLKEGVFFS